MKQTKRKMFVENLPKWEEHKQGDVGTINWLKCKKHKVEFIYDDIEGIVEIIDYKSKGQMLTIKYNDIEFKIQTSNFKRCGIGRLLGKTTKDFKIKIGTKLKDDKRDIIITDKEIRVRYKKNGKKYNQKWYKYTCNVCGWTEGWADESHLKQNQGCSCCYNTITVQGINDIPTTNPWMIEYFQGGYDEAKLYTKWGSGNPNNREGYIYPICPDCLRIKKKKMKISTIYINNSIGCGCSDNISYPEKVVFSILEQLGIDFQTQLSKTTFKWCNQYFYDFYFKLYNEDYVLEVNGNQHYEDAWDKLEITQQNDKLKKELALANGIKEENYIVIDCRKSDLEFIKDNILESNLAKLFDLSKIDWKQCQEFACSNLVKVACDYKKNNPDFMASDIGIIMKLSSVTIRKYLKKGVVLLWCKYDVKKEKIKGSDKSGKMFCKSIEIFKKGISLGIFESISELSRMSEKLFNVKLFNSGISRVCIGKALRYKGFVFKFTSDLNEGEIIQIQENAKQQLNKLNENRIKVILNNGLLRDFNNFKEAQDCLNINIKTLRRLYNNGKSYEAKFAKNGYNKYLDGLIVVSI